jgi:molybdenum cofactor cytidylyltransferase
MGRNKLTLEYGGESFLRGAARRALGAGLAPLVVVVGHEADRARAELSGFDCEIVVNPDYEEGINSSRRAGLAALPLGAEAAVVLLADMPFVTREMLAALVERYRATGAPLVLSSYGPEPGVNAPPTLYARSLFPELLALSGGACGGQVVKRHRAEAEILAWPERALFDVDRPEDLTRLDVSTEPR